METVDSRCEMELTASTSGTYFPRDFMVSINKNFLVRNNKIYFFIINLYFDENVVNDHIF
jgi:hypothetical protein